MGNGKPSLDIFATFYPQSSEIAINAPVTPYAIGWKGEKMKKKMSSSDNLHMHWLHSYT